MQQLPRLLSGIKVDADADEHRPERVMVIPAYLQIQQVVVVEEAVVQSFACRPFVVDGLILLAAPRDAGMETEVVVHLYVYRAPIAALATFGSVRILLDFAAFQRAAVLVGVFDFVKAPSVHRVSGTAERMGLLVQGDVRRKSIGGGVSAINVNQCANIPVFEQFVGRHVVMSGVQADVSGCDSGFMPAKSIDGI